MADGINETGKVPNGNGVILPNVVRGDLVRPSMFNRISEAVDRATVQQGVGVRVSRTSTSTTISIPQTFKDAHPFQAFFAGGGTQGYLTLKLGCVFGNIFPPQWRKNNSLPWAGDAAYTYINKQQGWHAFGAEIMFDIEGTNYLSSSHILSGDILALPFNEGMYYLEVTPWSGRQLATTGVDSLPPEYVAEIPGWNVYSLGLKGALKPTIKYAGVASMEKVAGNPGVIPICTVDVYKRIFQAVSSDIFLPLQRYRPFQVSLYAEGEDQYYSIYPGTVNRVTPKLNSEYLDASPPPQSIVLSEEGYVTIKCTYEENKFFPRTAEVVFIAGDNLTGWEDTETESYFPVAKINKTDGVYSVVQLSASNLVVNRLKAGLNQAVWWWDEMGDTL